MFQNFLSSAMYHMQQFGIFFLTLIKTNTADTKVWTSHNFLYNIVATKEKYSVFLALFILC